MNNLYYMVSDETATGEGSTLSIMICRAQPENHHWRQPPMWAYTPDGDPMYHEGELHIGVTEQNIAKDYFANQFGNWSARRCVLLDKQDFLANYGAFIPEAVLNMLKELPKWPPGFSWYQQLYVNYS